MSKKNGDRARFNRRRKAKLHDRTRVRTLRQTLQSQARPQQQSESIPQ